MSLTFASKLPQVGTTIFSVMSALAQQHQAVNLGQGFPDFDGDARLMDAVAQAMREGHNQYPPMPGHPWLREAIADKTARLYGHRPDPVSEITVTAGATQALTTIILSCVQRGDEVIILEPAYDSYQPAIELAGGRCVRVPLGADFQVDLARVASSITPKTRWIMVNTPHNPSGRVWHLAQWQALAELILPHPIGLISDEVYEHMVYDGRRHVSAWELPVLRERAWIVSSFGKTYHVTGWKVGYVLAPAAWTAELRKVHQFNVFTVNTPMQVGLARFMADPAPHEGLSAFYQAKRDHLVAGLRGLPVEVLPCEGTYFLTVNYQQISDLPDDQFAIELTRKHGVAAIPLSAFGGVAPEARLIRLCFAKKDATLDEALTRLRKAWT